MPTAAAKRSRSAAILSALTRYSGTAISPSSLTNAAPMPMPPETPSPWRTRSLFGLSPLDDEPSLLIEAAADQIGKRGYGALRFGSTARELDRGARTRGEHHQSHDRPSRDAVAVLANGNFGIEL